MLKAKVMVGPNSFVNQFMNHCVNPLAPAASQRNKTSISLLIWFYRVLQLTGLTVFHLFYRFVCVCAFMLNYVSLNVDLFVNHFGIVV